MSKNVIEVRNLSKRYKNRLVLNNVSFKVRAGTIHGFIGPNGAGKSTTINILRRLVLPTITKGYEVVYIDGKSVARDPFFNQNFGSISAEPEFLEPEVKKHLLGVGYLRDVSAAEVYGKVQKFPKLASFWNANCAELSTGWKKILQTFSLSLYKPKIFIFDEPLNGLDPTARYEFLENLKKIRTSGGTALISTHILSDLEKLAVEDITMIKEGRIVYTGPATADIEKTYEEYFIDKSRGSIEF